MKYLKGFVVGVIFEYLIKVDFHIPSLIAMILIIIGIILNELDETKIFKNKN